MTATPHRALRCTTASFALALPVSARAELPLPAYDEEVVIAAWRDVDRLISDACTWPDGEPTAGQAPLSCNPQRLDAAISVAQAFLSTVRDDGRLHTLVALAHRHAGRLDAARAELEAAVRSAPDRADAWHELGELRTLAGDHAGALQAFTRVTDLRPAGSLAWVAWFQRAQAAAFLGDAAVMETSLLEALRHGFTFRLIEDNPAWRGFYADPALRRPLERLLGVYADPGVTERLREAR